MGSRGGRHRLHRRARQDLRLRPVRWRRAGLRAMLAAAVGLVMIGGGAAALHPTEHVIAAR